MNWLVACLYKLWKAKSYLTDFWVGMFVNEYGRLVHETLKSAE